MTLALAAEPLKETIRRGKEEEGSIWIPLPFLLVVFVDEPLASLLRQDTLLEVFITLAKLALERLLHSHLGETRPGHTANASRLGEPLHVTD